MLISLIFEDNASKEYILQDFIWRDSIANNFSMEKETFTKCGFFRLRKDKLYVHPPTNIRLDFSAKEKLPSCFRDEVYK